ncbi:hypothetical protein [Exiguobacterium sp. s161]|uniref:hypothetical protein n=1 Tax=Exiguobacterium sp. s161 TaxID=2751191 RepID=UPI001BE51287|nr:hypothetical protein [Exiguobacterium sp. s161]
MILNGAGAMIPRLTIKTDNVKVQQLEVERLVVQEQAKKNVTFNRVKVTGKVQIESNTSAQKQDLTSSHLVRQAGPMTSMAKSRVISSNSEVIKSYNGASVIFINSDVEELVVTHPNTSVIVSNGAKIKNVILSANARIETNEGAVIEQLIIKRGTLYAEVDGTVQNCRLEAPVELEIVQDATIQNLTTAEEATIQGNGKIDHMSIADGSKSVEVNIAIRQLEVLTAEKIELIGTPKIDKLTIGESATSVALKIESNIPEVIIASKEVKMDVGTGVQITSLSIPAGSNVTDLITNYDKVDEQIKNPPIIIPPTTGGGTTPPTTGGGTTPPTTGGGTTPPTTGGETTPPQTKISDELDQVLDMKSDRYAVFDLTEELLDKLIESKEIESYQPELINDYRMYIQSMDIEELNSAEDVKRVLRKVKELKEIHVSKEQSLTLTPVASKWDDSERYYLSFNEPDIVRSYFKRNGNLVRMERYEDGRYSNYFGDLEKVEQGYRMWSSNHYDEVIFEKKDGSYSHLTMDQTDKKDDMVYLTQFNGKDIIVPNMQYQGEINQIDPEDMSYSYLDFDRFIYYEIPQMKSSVDIDHDGRQVDNGIDRMFSYRNEEEGKAIIGILKSLYEDGQFKGDLLIPGYAPTPFESKIDFKDIDQTKPFQFIFERYGREALLNRLGFELSDESISYPINLETIDGQTIEMKDVDIQRIPNRDGQALDEEDTVLSIDSNELKIDLKKSGSDTYLIKLGDFEQELSIDVFERFETKAIPVNKIKSKEMALEWMRRAILLNDVSSLPIELFRKIDPSYTAEGLPIYQAMLEQIDDEKAGDLTHFQEESNLLNQKLVQLRETKNEDFKVLNPSWILNESENPHLFTGGDDVLFVKEPNGTFNTRNGFNMSLEKINDRYFTNRYPLDLERSGSYEYYQFSQDTKTIERLQIEFGTTKDNLREVLRINGISVAEFLEKNASSDNTDQETDPTDSENEPTDDGDTNVPIDENIVQSSN